MIALLACACLAASARGAPPEQARPRIEGVEFPFGEPTSADRWCPVIVRISSGDGPVQGVVTLTYPQDGTQDVTIGVNAAVTPGVVVPVELAAALPRQATQLEVRFVSEGGRLLDARRLSINGGPGELLYKPTEGLARVLEVGGESVRVAFQDNAAYHARMRNSKMGAETQPDGGGGESTLADMIEVDAVTNLQALPHAWLSYECVDVVLANQTDLAKADARARGALLEWVSAGGRLVIVLDGAGPEWKRFVPGWEGLLSVGEVEVATPGDDVMRATLEAQPAPRGPVNGVARKDTPVRGQDTREPPPPTSFGMRLISLTKDAGREGWQVGWGVREHTEEGVGLVARGPLGMGMVSLVGVDFSRVVVTDPAGGGRNLWLSLWSDARLSPMPRRVLDETGVAGEVDSWRGVSWNTGGDPAAREAIQDAIDTITSRPEIGSAVIYGIGACVLVLALGIGPWEWIRAKRGKTSRRHLTRAMAWIGAMSVAGFLMPRMIRSGGSERRCAEAVDVMSQIGVEWRSGVVSSFAARPESVVLPERGPSWQRGVSEGFNRWDSSRRPGFAELRSTLLLGDGVRNAGAMVLAPAGQPQWTVRTFMYQSASRGMDESLPRVTVLPAGASWKVEVSGLTGGAKVSGARLISREGIAELELSPASGGVLHAEAARRLGADVPKWSGRFQPLARSDGEKSVGTSPGNDAYSLVGLPGARDRDDAIAARVLGGGYVCVLLDITDASDGYSKPGGGRQTLRVLMPRMEDGAP